MLASFLEELRILLEQIILSFGYVGITAVMFIENVFPPIPSEVIVPFSGFLVREGKLTFFLVLLATTVGVLLGAVVFYYLGALLGAARVRSIFKKYGKWALLSEKDFDHALSFFNKHSGSVVFWARFLPGLRSLISIPAGIAKMKFGTFLIFTLCGTVIWNVLLLTAGIYLGENWESILVFIDRFEMSIYILFFVLLTVWLVRRIRALRASREIENQKQ
ncbi:MAG: DedA family protein [Candidatus Paceibacterota bacterium]